MNSAHSEPVASSQSFDELWANEPEANETSTAASAADESDPPFGTCPKCGTVAQTADDVDAMGADNDNVFCLKCGAEYDPIRPMRSAQQLAETRPATAGSEPPTDPVEAVDSEESTDARESEAVIELGDNAEPIASAQVAAIDGRTDAERHFDQRREAATEYFVTCATARAKLEAALKVAKKREKDALENLSEIIDTGIVESPSPAEVANSPTAHKPGPILPPGCTSTTTPAGIAIHDPDCNGTAPPTHDPSAWKAVSINELDIKLNDKPCPSIYETLIESGIETIGQLENFRARVADHAGEWPKGIGKAKITAIEDAIVAWLTKHRDSHLFSSEGGAVTLDGEGDQAAVDAGIEYPTAEQWENMTEDQQSSWLNARAVHLDTDDLDALTTKDAEGTDKEWANGAESQEAGDLIVNCPFPPGDECDAWILGWLWQGKQETEE